MKIKNEFVLREVAGSFVVLATANATMDFEGMISLNESGALLWRTLENGADEDALVKAIIEEYEVEPKIAQADVKAFIEKLTDAGCIEI